MVGRDPAEPHRASTPLELLFDLSFVVAVAAAAAELHHGIAEDHVGTAVVGYLMVFFAIWWAWMNFTWFASAYDTDDAPYRVLTLVQIVGVLVLAAGVHDAVVDRNFTVITIGYLVMRIPLVLQWLRAARDDAERRPVAIRYAVGVTVVQAGWLLRLALSETVGLVAFFVLVAADVAVPLWAERAGRSTSWHPEHIAERYGLFTIIVLGESILAATTTIEEGLTEGGEALALAGVAGGGLLLVLGLWWVYFCRPAGEALRDFPGDSFRWGYGHYAMFAAVGALGAGIAVAAETVLHVSHVGETTAAFAVGVPVAVALLVLAGLQSRLAAGRSLGIRFVATAVLVLALAALTAAVPLPVTLVLMGLAVAGLVAVEVREEHRAAVSPRRDRVRRRT